LMVAIPALQPSTVRAIYKAYEDSNESWDSWGISVGELGTECDRSLFYTFRWTTEPEQVEGRIVRLFRRGDIEEERLVADLEAIGVDVFGRQDRIRLVCGHVRGKIDGRAIGVPEAPATEHLCEFKSAKDESFKAMVKAGSVRMAEPKHFVQIQLGMHMLGLSRGLYMMTNKNDETIYSERVEYDVEFCTRILARAERIVQLHKPPARIAEKADDFRCMFCKHKPICHGNAFPRVTCRSCLHSTAEMGGDGHWSCARWSKPLSIDEQKAGCPTHLFLPALVPGEQTDVDEENETVSYVLRDGSTWVDGAQPRES
jgi:hypothetical protein